jgi:hypothetical protein
MLKTTVSIGRDALSTMAAGVATGGAVAKWHWHVGADSSFMGVRGPHAASLRNIRSMVESPLLDREA